MPQMSPIMWLYLLLVFTISFIVYAVVLWFTPPKHNLKHFSSKKDIKKLKKFQMWKK